MQNYSLLLECAVILFGPQTFSMAKPWGSLSAVLFCFFVLSSVDFSRVFSGKKRLGMQIHWAWVERSLDISLTVENWGGVEYIVSSGWVTDRPWEFWGKCMLFSLSTSHHCQAEADKVIRIVVHTWLAGMCVRVSACVCTYIYCACIFVCVYIHMYTLLVSAFMYIWACGMGIWACGMGIWHMHICACTHVHSTHAHMQCIVCLHVHVRTMHACTYTCAY